MWLRKITIVPRVSVTETFTNNVRLSSANPKSEAITEVSPGIRISSDGGRIRGSIDYSLTEVFYANNSSGRRSLNNLSANGTVEAIDNWAFLDFSGNVGQQSISAFGTPSSGALLTGGNSTETSVYRISPYLRGRFGSNAEYEARYGYHQQHQSVNRSVRRGPARLVVPREWRAENVTDCPGASMPVGSPRALQAGAPPAARR
jgi:uncharacterized protein (PEP-CTERM system associated)